MTQRKREIGVRLALGATGGSVVRDILGRGMKLTVFGIVVGLAGAGRVLGAGGGQEQRAGAGQAPPVVVTVLVDVQPQQR